MPSETSDAVETAWPHQRTALPPPPPLATEPDGQGQRMWPKTPRMWLDLRGSLNAVPAGYPRLYWELGWPGGHGSSASRGTRWERSRGGGWTPRLNTSSHTFRPLGHSILPSWHHCLGASTIACYGKYKIIRLNKNTGSRSRNLNETFPIEDLKEEPAIWYFIGS